jgi:3-dehydroquinate synthase class II
MVITTQVPVVDPLGNQRPVVIGRIKIEERPLLLVEARTADGVCHSILLQNAETVRLVGPDAEGDAGWRALSVVELKPGDSVFVHAQAAARHTGVEIDERVVER